MPSDRRGRSVLVLTCRGRCRGPESDDQSEAVTSSGPVTDVYVPDTTSAPVNGRMPAGADGLTGDRAVIFSDWCSGVLSGARLVLSGTKRFWYCCAQCTLVTCRVHTCRAVVYHCWISSVLHNSSTKLKFMSLARPSHLVLPIFFHAPLGMRRGRTLLVLSSSITWTMEAVFEVRQKSVRN